MEKFNVFEFSCGKPNITMDKIGQGIHNAAYYYAIHDKFKHGIFYLFVLK